MSSVTNNTYKEFTLKRDISSFIKLFSVITWEKIGFVRRQKSLKFYEVTVTQNLLFQFRLLSFADSNSVKMFEAINETANGNDIELYIKTSKGYIFFPCQAKIANKDRELYKSIDHLITNKKTGTSEQQIESLIRYASTKHRKIKGIPIYLFYNYSDDAHVRSVVSSSTTDDIEVYGCTYVDARELVGTYYKSPKWSSRNKPSFSELHPSIGKPFYTLFTFLSKSSKTTSQAEIPLQGAVDFVFEQNPESFDSNNWVPVTEDLISEQPAISSINTQSVVESTESGFNPKYKLILNDSEIDTSLAKWLFM